MAKPFGKQPSDWLKTQYAKDYINAYSVRTNIRTADLVIVRQGAEPHKQGTWMHKDIAIEFASWLNPLFGIWCNDHIKELIIKDILPKIRRS